MKEEGLEESLILLNIGGTFKSYSQKRLLGYLMHNYIKFIMLYKSEWTKN